MRISLARLVLFAAIGLPIGFILTALAFAATETAISASGILPWALGIAALTGAVGAVWTPPS